MNKLFVKTFCSFYCFCQVHIRFISWCNCDCTGFLVWFYKSCLSLRPIVNKITSEIFQSDEQEAVSSKLRKDLSFFVWNLGFQGKRNCSKSFGSYCKITANLSNQPSHISWPQHEQIKSMEKGEEAPHPKDCSFSLLVLITVEK